jgi:hypothetical protein
VETAQLRAEGRVRTLTVSPAAMLGIATRREGTHTLRILDGLPPGATVVRAGYDLARDAFTLLVAHESFDPTPEGEHFLQQNVLVRWEIGADTALAALAQALAGRADQHGEAGLTYHESFRGWCCPCCDPEERGERDTYHAYHAEDCPLAAALALTGKE